MGSLRRRKSSNQDLQLSTKYTPSAPLSFSARSHGEANDVEIAKCRREYRHETSSGLAMLPASAVSALVFSHPQSKYFAVGHVNEDQIDSYSERKNESKEYIEKWCAPLLNYK